MSSYAYAYAYAFPTLGVSLCLFLPLFVSASLSISHSLTLSLVSISTSLTTITGATGHLQDVEGSDPAQRAQLHRNGVFQPAHVSCRGWRHGACACAAQGAGGVDEEAAADRGPAEPLAVTQSHSDAGTLEEG